MKNNFYITFGIWIAVLPFLGIPGSWRDALISLSGLFLVLVAIGPTILKKLQNKPKAKKRAAKIPADNTPKDSNSSELRFSKAAPETPASPTTEIVNEPNESLVENASQI